MPPALLLDIEPIDLDHVRVTREKIYETLPHAYEFQLLDGLLYMDEQRNTAVAYHDVSEDAFWVRGHLPGRPLFPGILMIEAAAHLASFMASRLSQYSGRFLGLAGVGNARFRDTVLPGTRLHILASPIEIKARRMIWATQGVVDGRLVFEAEICGMPV
jgi:3-hydroxyacyl-[acyl-carrier-protein] dehydratase